MPAARVGIVVFDGVDELDFAGAWAVLRKAAQLSGGAVDAVLLGPPRVTASHGLRFETGADYGEIARCHAVVVPGGPGAAALAADAACGDGVRALVAAGGRVYSVCSGALLLAGLGILPPGPVAIHARKAAALAAAGARPAAGVARADWLVSIGGEANAPYVKSVEMGFRVLRDLCPEAVAGVAERMECGPHRGAG
jgi:transcriptional regulator GlxA family with amidase domain